MKERPRVADQYYSKALDQYFPTRLDVLLYAHDGRGLGHAGRTIGIGMAIRRLYPDLRVLFVSGAAISQSLIGRSGLDWIKLPSYASRIKDGVSSGVNGPANFYKSVLGQHRARMLAQIVESFRPKVILADHSPLGKREELIPALERSEPLDTKWVLGLRAVIGNPKNFWSDRTRQVFESFYHSIFWYGDPAVLGSSHMDRIEQHFGRRPKPMGYVSRLYETRQLLNPADRSLTGTISLPWLSRESRRFVQTLKQAIARRPSGECWNIFINNNDFPDVKRLFSDLPNVRVEPVGEAYAQTLLNSKMAIIYGGYNSLMDAAAAEIPAIVVMREMKDNEQDEHIRQLLCHTPRSMIMVEESQSDADGLEDAVTSLLSRGCTPVGMNIKGSEAAARKISDMI